MAAASMLVVYFSRSGTTRRMASALAGMLDADLDAIREADRRDRAGACGYLRSLADVLGRRPARLAPGNLDPAAYDVVIIGTPVWAHNVSTPVRSWLTLHRAGLRHAAFFCTLGGSGQASALAQMRALAGQPPLAECAITARDVQRGTDQRLLSGFAQQLRQNLSERALPEPPADTPPDSHPTAALLRHMDPNRR